MVHQITEAPHLSGIGIASMVILIYLNATSMLMPVWSLFYLYSSFKSPLPWTTCDNGWNTGGMAEALGSSRAI